jgi:hypothetical protein
MDRKWVMPTFRGRPPREHGLLRPSFIPPRPIRELRGLTRYRKVLNQHRATEVDRVRQLLEVRYGTRHSPRISDVPTGADSLGG